MASEFMQNWPPQHRALVGVSIFLLLACLGLGYFIVWPKWVEYDDERTSYLGDEKKVAESQWPRDAERMQGLLDSYKKVLGSGKEGSGGLRAQEISVNKRATSMFTEDIKREYGSSSKFMSMANNTEYKRCFDETSLAINTILKTTYSRIPVGLEPEIFGMDVEQTGSVYVNMLKLWTTRRVVELVNNNNLDIGIDPDYVRSGGIRAAKIIALPVTTYTVYPNDKAAYLLEIPVKIEIHGRMDDFMAFIADLQSGNNFLPILNLEMTTENPQQRFRGMGMYSRPDQDGHIAIQNITATIVCASFFNLEGEEGAKAVKAPVKTVATPKPIGI